MRGYRRDDGLYDIEGHLRDAKSVSMDIGTRRYEPDETVHDMWVRLVVDESLVVRDVIAVSDVTPFPVCKEAAAAMRSIVGQRIAPGWSLVVKSRLGGKISCTHLMEMLIPMGTAAFQTLAHVRLAKPDKLDPRGRPLKIDSCYAYASGTEVVRHRWPEFYTGEDA